MRDGFGYDNTKQYLYYVLQLISYTYNMDWKNKMVFKKII